MRKYNNATGVIKCYAMCSATNDVYTISTRESADARPRDRIKPCAGSKFPTAVYIKGVHKGGNLQS